jgi:cation diffusion facilitator family transporter
MNAEAETKQFIDAPERASIMRRVTVVGALVNLILSVLKIVFGFIGQSHSLIADGIHSFSDLLSDALVFFAAHHAHQEPDEQHPYGHGRFETAATLGLSLFLFLVAAGLIWDATERLFAPETLLNPSAVALYVAALSVIAKEWLYHYTRLAARRINSNLMRANAWHHRSDAVSSVVVLVGVGGTMAGLAYLDAIASVIVGLMIARIGWELGWGSVQELVDTGLEAHRIDAIRATISKVDGVRGIHMLRTRRMGGSASADVHVLVDPELSVSEGHMISVMVEQSLKREIHELDDVTVHIDPEDDEEAPPCLGLPTRSQVIAILDSLWRDYPRLRRRNRLVLHYLSGKIHVDIYLPLDALPGLEQRASLQRELTQSLVNQKEFGRIRAFFD